MQEFKKGKQQRREGEELREWPQGAEKSAKGLTVER
jgi:hypothetical protein